MRFLSTFIILACFILPTSLKAEPFTLDKLPYGYDELEPAISATTMEIHYSKHHQGYVNKLNEAVNENSDLNGKSLEEILMNVSAYSDKVRNNAGGHWNHTFFWKIMTPENKQKDMSLELKSAILKQFGSIETMKEAFEKVGLAQFGSGWVWLVVKNDNTLAITSTPNQDNPSNG